MDDLKDLNMALQPMLADLREKINTGVEEEAVSKIKVKPLTYDGKTSWPAYLKQFSAAAAANRWTQVEKAIALVVALRGDALDTLQSIPDSKLRDYKYLLSRLEMRFGDGHLQQVYRAQMKNAQQKPEQTLQEFGAEINRLVRLSYPTFPDEVLEQLGVQTFADGVRDSEIC